MAAMRHIVIFTLAFSACHRASGIPVPDTKAASVSISFFATDLSGCDWLSKCDTSVTIMCASAYSDWKVCGRTRRIRNNNNPTWPEIYTFEHQVGSYQRMRLDLKDHNFVGSTLISSFNIIVDEYMNRAEHLLSLEVPDNRGFLWVKRLQD